LHAGVFGARGEHLALFDGADPSEASGVRNFAGNYLIWMASGGTRVMFPPSFSDLVGAYGPNMLHRLRDQFVHLLPHAKDPIVPIYQAYEIYADVATLENPITPDVGFAVDGTPIDAAAQDAWLTRAEANAGWMLFRFFRDEAAKNAWPKTPNDCDQVFPSAPE
jgi:hypothetical protein